MEFFNLPVLGASGARAEPGFPLQSPVRVPNRNLFSPLK
jgi:hypothetical protein